MLGKIKNYFLYFYQKYYHTKNTFPFFYIDFDLKYRHAVARCEAREKGECDMKQLKEINTEQEIREIVEEIIGEGKECEKNLLSAVLLFLLRLCPNTEHDFTHALQLVLATKVSKGQRHPQSDLDKLFEQVMTLDPMGAELRYYQAYKCYPDGMQGQAAGNVAYKISPIIEEELKEYERQRKEVKYSIEDVEKMIESRLAQTKKWEEIAKLSAIDIVGRKLNKNQSQTTETEEFAF